MSIFTKSNEATHKPNRNTFDGRFTNNLTLKMGMITPCFCKEVMTGDTFKIDPSFGFNLMPFTHPVQTKIRANLHFFYVRNRALWRGWESFITKTDNEWNDTTPPYIVLTDENRSMVDTGNIGDFLGVPTVAYSSSETTIDFNITSNSPNGVYYLTGNTRINNSLYTYFSNKTFDDSTYNNYKAVLSDILNTFTRSTPNATKYPSASLPSNTFLTPIYYSSILPGTISLDVKVPSLLSQLYKSGMTLNSNDTLPVLTALIYDNDKSIVDYAIIHLNSQQVSESILSSSNFSYNDLHLQWNPSSPSDSLHVVYFVNYVYQGTYNITDLLPVLNVNGQVIAPFYPIPNKVRALADLPFYNTANGGGQRISALPFRAVDACYNAFFRDIRNNPFISNGKPLYNKWVYSNEGGADYRHFELYRANWEQDAYTTAVQSPQQGIAPLVGVTATGQMTFKDEEGNTYTAQATFGEDGETITGISTHSPDMPVGTLRALVDTISSGISINDFRNVNAYQVWLEKNMRKGLRYKDQLEAHFGSSPTYSELQMPEFIGGMSRVVDMRAVTQTSSDTPDSPLGTLAGQASLMSEGSSISHYCDEHGFIIGFISFVPTPIYSQLLPKMLTKSERFDYYFPEFGNIGFQPILNKELAILQCTNEEGKRPDDVFGYQRAWHEYISNVDEAHGEFRESMRNYIIHRTYASVPELGADFLTVSPNEANDVFAVQEDTDKIWGQIYFDVKMKRPIPKYGIPSLKVE